MWTCWEKALIPLVRFQLSKTQNFVGNCSHLHHVKWVKLLIFFNDIVIAKKKDCFINYIMKFSFGKISHVLGVWDHSLTNRWASALRYNLLLSIVAMKLCSSICEMKLSTNWGKFCCCSEVRNLMQRRGYHRDRHRYSEACVRAFLIVTRYLIFNQEALMTNGYKVGKCYFHPQKYCFSIHTCHPTRGCWCWSKHFGVLK